MTVLDQHLFKNETKKFIFGYPPDHFILESGDKIGPITVAYETYGKLDKKRTNAILVAHALSGDAHVARNRKKENTPGWWDNLIGPGKGLDTNKYFVVCSNVIGGCMGSTGPSSINPLTGYEYGIDFPIVSIGDMVNAQKRLIDSLGIEKLLSVIGGSMGGMQALQWMIAYPERIRSSIPIATAMKHTPQQIALNEVGRQAIIADPNWKKGQYYDSIIPAKGLALARMIGHITYMSEVSMAKKFGRRFKSRKEHHKFDAEFEVEEYLRYQGDNFVKRFDANSYLYLTKAIDYFNILNGKRLPDIFKGLKAKVLVIAFKSDWLYPSHQSQEIVKACKLSGVDTTYCEINSTYGHDAFLLEIEEEEDLIKHFLNTVANDSNNGVEEHKTDLHEN